MIQQAHLETNGIPYAGRCTGCRFGVSETEAGGRPTLTVGTQGVGVTARRAHSPPSDPGRYSSSPLPPQRRQRPCSPSMGRFQSLPLSDLASLAERTPGREPVAASLQPLSPAPRIRRAHEPRAPRSCSVASGRQGIRAGRSTGVVSPPEPRLIAVLGRACFAMHARTWALSVPRHPTPDS